MHQLIVYICKCIFLCCIHILLYFFLYLCCIKIWFIPSFICCIYILLYTIVYLYFYDSTFIIKQTHFWPDISVKDSCHYVNIWHRWTVGWRQLFKHSNKKMENITRLKTINFMKKLTNNKVLGFLQKECWLQQISDDCLLNINICNTNHAHTIVTHWTWYYDM